MELYKKSENLTENLKYILNQNLIHIDSDTFTCQEEEIIEIVFKKLLEIWLKSPSPTVTKMIKELCTEIEISDEDQKDFDSKFVVIRDTNTRERVEKENKQEKVKGKIEKDNKKIGIEKKKIDIIRDVLPCIIPLICFLTMKTNISTENFTELINVIKNDEMLLEIFNDQSLIWWKKDDLIDTIEYIVTKYVPNVFELVVKIKIIIKSMINFPKELLEFLSGNLKPKSVEKKKFGEVFTPLSLISEMLDHLPNEVWSNPNLKWIDPANGMGNFPIAVYLRLMEGLKEQIPNEKERKRHIIEEQLYMIELNKKNCFIAKQVFDIKDEYHTNICNGNTLEISTEDEFKVEKFDIIMGNPPYQKENKKSTKARGGKGLYLDFVEWAYEHLSDGGYLVLIHPLAWRKIGSKHLDYFFTEQYYI